MARPLSELVDYLIRWHAEYAPELSELTPVPRRLSTGGRRRGWLPSSLHPEIARGRVPFWFPWCGRHGRCASPMDHTHPHPGGTMSVDIRLYSDFV